MLFLQRVRFPLVLPALKASNKYSYHKKQRIIDPLLFILQREVVTVAKRLTDKQKKKIIADYVECGNYSQVARKHKVAESTVRRTVHADGETAKKAEQKKEQNTADILEFMDSKKDDVCNIISLYLTELQNTDRLKNASIQSIATSLGIIIDKFTRDAQKQSDTSLFSSIAKAAGGFKIE